MPVTIHLKSNRFGEIAKQFHEQVSLVVRKTTLDIEAGAKQLSPVDTGLLRSSIQSKMDGDLTGIVFTNTEYAVYVEFGTRRMSAQPYLTPSVESARHPFIQALQSIGRNLD